MPGDELEFVHWLSRRTPRSACVRLGVGDDMAEVRTPGPSVLISSDMLLDGVHFDLASQAPERIGRKALGCSLSDCAAMAVRPVAATISLALPGDLSLELAKAMYEGMYALAGEFDVPLVGGDTTRWKHPLVIDVAILAEPWPGIAPVLRSGAKPGDALYTTGKVGGSALGHHLDFTPRVHEARELARRLGPRLHAMIDISDGLSLDLWRICQASNAGAVLDERGLMQAASDAASELARRDGGTALDHVLGDGEDFELILAVGGEIADSPVRLYPIGRMVDSGLRLSRVDGTVIEVAPRGYVH